MLAAQTALWAAFATVGGGCVQDIDLSTKACPCAFGYSCVAGTCVAVVGGDGGGRDTRFPDAGNPDGARPRDAARDAPVDSPTDPGETPSDAAAVDAEPDARSIDAGDPLCIPDPLADTVFRFDFTSATFPLADATGRHTATLVGPVPTVAEGRCETGLLFDGSSALVVADSAAFDLPSGSYDFWARHTPGTHVTSGLVSRDANNRDLPGHATLFWSDDNRIMARIQNVTGEATRCSTPGMPLGEWVHIGVNFGGPNFELWVNGEQVDEAGEILAPFGGMVPCARSATFTDGVDGNANPWVFGADAGVSLEGGSTPLNGYFRGTLERVRLSDVRRDFSIYSP